MRRVHVFFLVASIAVALTLWFTLRSPRSPISGYPLGRPGEIHRELRPSGPWLATVPDAGIAEPPVLVCLNGARVVLLGGTKLIERPSEATGVNCGDLGAEFPLYWTWTPEREMVIRCSDGAIVWEGRPKPFPE